MLNFLLIILFLGSFLSDEQIGLEIMLISGNLLLIRLGLAFYQWTKNVSEPFQQPYNLGIIKKSVQVGTSKNTALNLTKNNQSTKPVTKPILGQKVLEKNKQVPKNQKNQNEDMLIDLSEYMDSYRKTQKQKK